MAWKRLPVHAIFVVLDVRNASKGSKYNGQKLQFNAHLTLLCIQNSQIYSLKVILQNSTLTFTQSA